MTKAERYRQKYPSHQFFENVNLNPKDNITTDCVIRAMAGVTGSSWDDAFMALVDVAMKKKVAMNTEKAYGAYLQAHGFTKMKQITNPDGTKMTGKQFCQWLFKQYKYKGSYRVFANVGAHHVICILPREDGTYYVQDTWDSSMEKVGKWWVKPL
ncbi:MAG: hypothetical protein IJA19_00115 [Clostridia bacterium]|nr:hypothetical protein [Clostridia bacterium]